MRREKMARKPDYTPIAWFILAVIVMFIVGKLLGVW
jgi:hypothetical protein